MHFTLEELEDIWLTYQSHGVTDNFVIEKILAEYTYCHLCNHLIPLADFQQHFDDHD